MGLAQLMALHHVHNLLSRSQPALLVAGPALGEMGWVQDVGKLLEPDLLGDEQLDDVGTDLGLVDLGRLALVLDVDELVLEDFEREVDAVDVVHESSVHEVVVELDVLALEPLHHCRPLPLANEVVAALTLLPVLEPVHVLGVHIEQDFEKAGGLARAKRKRELVVEPVVLLELLNVLGDGVLDGVQLLHSVLLAARGSAIRPSEGVDGPLQDELLVVDTHFDLANHRKHQNSYVLILHLEDGAFLLLERLEDLE
mmetsp:Transcript_5830/g.9327  ORF Transcript_5830/g.9327 Transcript_5830/m.9327 type:complete len:255 (-) Transcript_5830:2070-2834(-)|eukprot:CAMPEP_0170482530 /NCGR_PEP_ID=MMETSP0208-20121228/2509_1 /TAXON_ID=197538 /ORGANISM="Strombidium inclinatum, Strain S3" /LENGTH=254 /DNA_ID=CAMNT_0010755379 /DNA_START=1757 /DNA_END=2521 /DNA_ORIENTATION=+